MEREFIGIMGTLSCRVEEEGDVVSVALEGKADVYSSPELVKLLEAYLGRGRFKIILDLEKLEYLDSSTLAGFLKIQKRIERSGGGLKLVKLTGEPRKVFQVSGFLDLFEHFPDRTAARSSFEDD